MKTATKLALAGLAAVLISWMLSSANQAVQDLSSSHAARTNDAIQLAR